MPVQGTRASERPLFDLTFSQATARGAQAGAGLPGIGSGWPSLR